MKHSNAYKLCWVIAFALCSLQFLRTSATLIRHAAPRRPKRFHSKGQEAEEESGAIAGMMADDSLLVGDGESPEANCTPDKTSQ